MNRNTEILTSQVMDILNNTSKDTYEPVSQEFLSVQELLLTLAQNMKEFNSFLQNISVGNLDVETPKRGNVIADKLKELHANLMYLTWQTQQIAAGDYDQQVDFLGDFSESFNLMAKKLKDREAELLKEQQFNEIVMGLSNDAFFDYDILVNQIRLSEDFANQFGLPTILDNFPQSLLDADVLVGESKDKMVNFSVDRLVSTSKSELCFQSKDGKAVWYSVHCDATTDSLGIPIRLIGKMTDITEQKEQIKKLTQKAERDPLTKLFNKEESRTRIERYLEKSHEFEDSAVMLIDIDNFKGVNDTLGHQFGDSVLVDVSMKLKGIFRDSDIVGRLGGDEFVVLMKNIKSDNIVAEKANAITNAFRHTFSGVQNDYKISGSVGIALCPTNATTFEELYNMADSALYGSKKKGKDCYTFYHEELMGQVNHGDNPMDAVERFVASYFANDSIYNIFEMLYETNDLYTTVNRVLSVIGNKYEVDRCYIFEYSSDNNFINNTYEWCANNISSEKDLLQNIPISNLDNMFKLYNEDGIFFCNDMSSLDSYTSDLLRQQGIQSLIHCALYDQGEIRGFIGFDACNKPRIWTGEEIAMLSYVSKILSVFLGSKRIKYR